MSIAALSTATLTGNAAVINYCIAAVITVVALWMLVRYYLTPLYWRFHAASFLRERNYEQAVDAFDRSLKRSPRGARLWFGKGATLHRLGRLTESIAPLTKALELDEGQPRILLELAQVYRELRRYDDALGLVDRASSCGEFRERALFARCAIKIEAQRFQQAESDCSLALDSCGETVGARIYSLRGVARLMLGRLDDAQADFETSYLLDPQSMDTRSYCAAVWYRRRLYDKTIMLCNSILDREPHNALALYFRGLAERALGHDAAAEKDLNRVKELKEQGSTSTMLSNYSRGRF
jgi:tetratricopeptide (TPR) repeat protein